MGIDRAKLTARLREKQAKDLLRRGFKVQARARVLLGGAAGHPRRIRTKRLWSSVQVQLRAFGGSPVVRIGTNVRYSRRVHDGTGIYGPRRRPIRPKRGKFLVFTPRNGIQSRKVFVREVKGMRQNQYLRDALPAARD